MKNLLAVVLGIGIAQASFADQRTNRFELEAGVVSTQNMEIRGFNQGNATADWQKTGLAYRLEYWSEKAGGWNYGVVAQPLSLSYSDVIKNRLDAKGRVFSVGSPSTLLYEFPTVRFSANRPLLTNDEGDYLRGGGSAILRFARVKLSSGVTGFSDTNLILIPVFNLEAKKSLGAGWSLFTRSDFLPGVDGNLLLDGLFDVFLGVRKKVDPSANIDIGVRTFFGGYDPKKADDYANRIFFNSVVVRYSW